MGRARGGEGRKSADVDAALRLLPTQPQVVLYDKGSEFESDFTKTLQALRKPT
jgi:hypothetical protein